MEYHTAFHPLDSWDISNDFDWLENAIARDLQDPAAALPYEVEQLSEIIERTLADSVAATIGLMPERTSGSSMAVVSAMGHAQSTNNLFHGGANQNAVHCPTYRLVKAVTPAFSANGLAKNMISRGTLQTGMNTVVCVQADDAPSGKQPAKILRCGLCMSSKLFDRRYELERHMSIHFPGQYPCMQPGCTFFGPRAFKRADKLVKHKREAHGL
ncbi:hypothetical protein LTR17_018393 [Elasticomyces elasticus]|nr:hypothetical protein LTR17_018393 [Elasticomyces elasticus]